MSDSEFKLAGGEKLEVSAIQMILLVDKAICNFYEKLCEYKRKEEEGQIILGSLDTTEVARDEVVRFFKEELEKKLQRKLGEKNEG